MNEPAMTKRTNQPTLSACASTMAPQLNQSGRRSRGGSMGHQSDYTSDGSGGAWVRAPVASALAWVMPPPATVRALLLLLLLLPAEAGAMPRPR